MVRRVGETKGSGGGGGMWVGGWVGVGELGVVDYTLERNTSKEVLSLAPLVGFSSGSCWGEKEV